MKIALCFSGQIRTGVEVAPNILNYLGDLRENCDIFVHTWDVETSSQHDYLYKDQDKLDKIKNLHFEVKDKNVFSNFRAAYLPTTMIVEPYNSVETTDTWGGRRQHKKHANKMVAMFESIYEANKLKKMHEEKYDFKYDYVVRIRPDLVFHPRKSLKQDIDELDHPNWGDILQRRYNHRSRATASPNSPLSFVYGAHFEASDHLEDIFWISNSEIGDTLAEYGVHRANCPAGVEIGEPGYIDWQIHMATWTRNELGLNYIELSDNAIRVYYQSHLESNMEILNPLFGDPPNYGLLGAPPPR